MFFLSLHHLTICTSSPPITQQDPFLLPLCHNTRVLSQLAALASPGHPPLAAVRTVWRFLPTNSSWRGTLASHTSQPPSLPHRIHIALSAAPSTQLVGLRTNILPPAPEMAEAIITHLAQQNYPAQGRRGRKQLEIIHGERCSHPQCLGVCLTPNQPSSYRQCAPRAL